MKIIEIICSINLTHSSGLLLVPLIYALLQLLLRLWQFHKRFIPVIENSIPDYYL